MLRSKSLRSRVWVAVVALLTLSALAACSSSGGDPGPGTVTQTVTSTPTGSSDSPSPTHTKTSKPAAPTKPVHVSSLEGDGQTYGVGMPIILRFTPTPTDSSAFTKAVTVTVNGQPAKGAWYWERPLKGQPMEAHYRPENGHYWSPNSTIQVKLPIKGLSAGKGLSYSGGLTSVTFKTGDTHISTVDARSKRMTVTSNGKFVKKIKVSLGAAKTPTYNGVKVVMQKGEDVPGTDKRKPDGTVQMKGPGYNEAVKWSVRVTNSGEYIHAAPWNSHLGQLSTSNGCTNLSTADAKWFYKFSLVGDVVIYSHTDGTRMPSWDGYGDWNLNWNTWKNGGQLINH